MKMKWKTIRKEDMMSKKNYFGTMLYTIWTRKTMIKWAIAFVFVSFSFVHGKKSESINYQNQDNYGFVEWFGSTS